MLSRASTMTPAPPRAMGANLLLFFAFALAALLLLTQTLVSVTQVQADVNDAVQPATSGIVDNTALLSQLTHTNQLTGQMLEAAQHINGSLIEVDGATQQISTRIDRVRSASLDIATSVAGIRVSSAVALRGVAGLHMAVDATDLYAAQVASSLAGARRAVAPLRNLLGDASASLQALLALIPSISRQTLSITGALAEVDGHLMNVDANGLVRLTNLLQLGSLVSPVASNGK